MAGAGERRPRLGEAAITKYVRFAHAARVGYGVLEDDMVHPVAGEIPNFEQPRDAPIPLAEVTLLPPTVPTKILATGPNYRSSFVGRQAPTQPIIWQKPVSALNGPEGVIRLPPGQIVNHEVELAVVIGRLAREVTVDEAADHIFGYTILHDVTAGDFSTMATFIGSHQYVDGKIYDTFAPVGPVIETSLDTSDLHLETRVNGEVRQSHSTSDFMFQPAWVVSFVSGIMTLNPGDVISMGSPPGVAPMKAGDVVEVEVEGIGILRNHVRARGE